MGQIMSGVPVRDRVWSESSRVVNGTSARRLPIIYLGRNLQRILKGCDPRISGHRFMSGLTSNPWLLVDRETGQEFVIKEVTHSDGYQHQDLFAYLSELSARASFVPEVYGLLSDRRKIYVIYEYARKSRCSTFKDTKQVLLAMLKATDNDMQAPYQQPIRDPYVMFLEPIFAQVFTLENLRRILPDVPPQTVGLLTRLCCYFISSHDFAELYRRLPVTFVHRDIKPLNIIPTFSGPKLIDWDSARFTVRVVELSQFAILALERGTLKHFQEIIETLPYDILVAGVALKDNEIEAFPYYILLNMLFWQALAITNFSQYPPKVKTTVANALRRQLTFIHQVVADNNLLGVPVSELVPSSAIFSTQPSHF